MGKERRGNAGNARQGRVRRRMDSSGAAWQERQRAARQDTDGRGNAGKASRDVAGRGWAWQARNAAQG